MYEEWLSKEGRACCAGLPKPAAGLVGHEANMEELGCIGDYGCVWGLRECMGAPLGYGRCMGPENP